MFYPRTIRPPAYTNRRYTTLWCYRYWRTTPEPGTDASTIRHQTEVSTCFLQGVADSPLCLSEDRQSARLTARAPAPRHSWPSSLITPPQEPHGGLTRSRIREGGWENKLGSPTPLDQNGISHVPLLTSGGTALSYCDMTSLSVTITRFKPPACLSQPWGSQPQQ